MIASLCQAVIQAAPNTIYVREAPGMPEWVKILISAGTGALFAILGNIAMEFIKPTIARRSSKREVRKQLLYEVRENVRLLDQVRTILKEDPPPKNRIPHALAVLKRINDERYRFYSTEEMIFVYEIDRGKNLEKLYRLSKRDVPGAIENGGVSAYADEPGTAAELLEYAHFVGTGFIRMQTQPLWNRVAEWLKDHLAGWRR